MGPLDIVNGNEKAILRLIWTIILSFQIAEEGVRVVKVSNIMKEKIGENLHYDGTLPKFKNMHP